MSSSEMEKAMSTTSDPIVGVITGGLTGIGAACAIEFATRGAKLVLCGPSAHAGGDLATQVREAGGEAVILEADVRDPDAQLAVAQRAVDEWGQIDFLVANAGIAEQSKVVSGDPASWRDVIETNLLGAMYSCRAVLPAMQQQRRGHILIMSSVSGREAYVGEPAYIASKWGQVGFAHALRLELLTHGIRVTLVEPGLVDSPLTRDNPKVAPLLAEIDPLTPADVARAVVWAYAQPPHVAVTEVVVRPQAQRLPDL
jgi:NADP-dependent 3-hydroxy acid dehydrogenase YdfG